MPAEGEVTVAVEMMKARVVDFFAPTVRIGCETTNRKR